MALARVYSEPRQARIGGCFLKGEARGSSSFPSSLIESNGFLRLWDARVESLLRSLKEAPRGLTADEVFLPVCVTAAWTSVQTSGQGVRIRKFPPGGPGPRHLQEQKRHIPYRFSATMCSLWTGTLGVWGRGYQRFEARSTESHEWFWSDLFRVELGSVEAKRAAI